MLYVVGFVLVFSLALGLYLLFKDTLNKFQSLPKLRIYWITKDDATGFTPWITRAWVRQDQAPFWRGSGIQIRFSRTRTFQLGVLTKRVSSLEEQLDAEWLDVGTQEIKTWQ